MAGESNCDAVRGLVQTQDPEHAHEIEARGTLDVNVRLSGNGFQRLVLHSRHPLLPQMKITSTIQTQSFDAQGSFQVRADTCGQAIQIPEILAGRAPCRA
jgi:hypothetical protein